VRTRDGGVRGAVSAGPVGIFGIGRNVSGIEGWRSKGFDRFKPKRSRRLLDDRTVSGLPSSAVRSLSRRPRKAAVMLRTRLDVRLRRPGMNTMQEQRR
jgi:hypothetical protein